MNRTRQTSTFFFGVSRCSVVAFAPLILALLSSLALSGCSTFIPKSYDPNQPLTVNHGFFGSPLMQVTQADSSGENSGKETSIDFDSATKTLGDNPEIQPHTERFRWYEAAGIVLEVGGGIELLDGWGRGHSGNAVVGLVALGLGVGATLLARSELSSAVDIHNRSLATPPPNQSKVILPTLSVLAEHTRLTPVFGVQLEF